LLGSASTWSQDGTIDLRDATDERIERLLQERKRREEELARQPSSLNGGETVNPVFLDSIRDFSIGIRFEERDAYFRILDLARTTPLAKQEEFAMNFREARRMSNPRYAKRKPEQFPVFVDMFQAPDDYRGRPVSLHGVMRSLTKIDPGKNDRMITEAYEGWVYPDEGQGNPAVVVFLSKPEGLPVGGDITEEVRLTGYFFKMYGYQAQEKVRKAPLILAEAVEWRAGPKSWKPQSLGAEVYLGITMVVLLLGFVWWQGNRREMTSTLRPDNADFSKLPPIELPRESNVPAESIPTETQDS
jgi:hypothetical protein